MLGRSVAKENKDGLERRGLDREQGIVAQDGQDASGQQCSQRWRRLVLGPTVLSVIVAALLAVPAMMRRQRLVSTVSSRGAQKRGGDERRTSCKEKTATTMPMNASEPATMQGRAYGNVSKSATPANVLG